MSNIVKFNRVEEKIITIRGQNVILDSDVAELYGVETKRINEAVKNNPDKFPEGYIFELNQYEWNNLKSKISTSSWGGKHKRPQAFTEKGLYMLATILKSPVAVQTTIAIVETFTKVRMLSQKINELAATSDKNSQKKLMQSSGELITELYCQRVEIGCFIWHLPQGSVSKGRQPFAERLRCR